MNPKKKIARCSTSLLLIVVLLLAACQSAPTRVSTLGPIPTSAAIPGTGAKQPGLVKVLDQTLTGNTVAVPRVISKGPGWITIHTQQNGTIGPVIGEAHVENGENNNVTVTIDPSKATPVMYAMLHVDAGVVGTYEFPGPDVPVTINGVMVSPPFHVTLP